MKNLSFFALFILFVSGGLAAQQQIFVLYDASCMLRVNYEQAIAQQPRMDYFAYQVPLANGNKLILETGVEGSVRQNYLPPDYLSCNDPRLNADFADGINGNRTKVFMLIPEGNDFLIQPVTMGAILAKQANLITYVSPLASFQFDTRNVIIGENLSFNNSIARVFFEGREDNLCGGTYLIRQLMPRNAYPVIDYKINPELGVIERRLGSDGTTTVGGVTVARTVNNIPVANFLATNCGGQPVTQSGYANGPLTYNSGVVPPAGYTPAQVNYNQGSNPVYTQPVTTQPQTVANTTLEAPTHTVAKSETLYGLSRRYEVSVDQIKEWNNLRSNNIAVGQELRVGASAFVPVNASNIPVMVNRGPVANSNPGAAQPTPYGPVSQPQSVATPAEQQHIVQPGETVASVALRYGYTEAKFREVNGLGANEYIRVGQRMKISDCNCPAATSVATQSAPNIYQSGGVVVPQSFQQPAPTVYTGTPVGPTANFNTPQTPTYQPPAYQPQYSTYQQPSTVSPPAYGAPAPQQYGGGIPATPKPYTQPSSGQKSGNGTTTITNDPGFGAQAQGQVIPNVYRAPAGQSMNTLEGGGNAAPIIGGKSATGTPSTYGSQIYTGSQAASYSAPSVRSVHVVQEGESLNSIASRYNLTITRLRELNDLQRADIIIPFQRLYIN